MTISREIAVMWKCHCMAKEQVLSVPSRREGEDIVAWMQTCVQPALYIAHRRRSPLCQSAMLDYLKIPTEGDAPFGSAPKVN